MRRFAFVLLGCFVSPLVAAGPAWAYDAEAGRRMAETSCLACHGEDGVSALPTVPSIGGQWNDYIVLALFQFRNGHRPSEVMGPIAKPLTDSDLGNLAKYYSSLKPWGPVRQAAPAAVAAGPGLTREKNCIQCHAPGLAGQDSVPRIAGQQIDFLTEQLRGFRAGTRGDIDGNMSAAVKDLTDADIATLVDYVSGLATP